MLSSFPRNLWIYGSSYRICSLNTGLLYYIVLAFVYLAHSTNFSSFHAWLNYFGTSLTHFSTCSWRLIIGIISSPYKISSTLVLHLIITFCPSGWSISTMNSTPPFKEKAQLRYLLISHLAAPCWNFSDWLLHQDPMLGTFTLHFHICIPMLSTVTGT